MVPYRLGLESTSPNLPPHTRRSNERRENLRLPLEPGEAVRGSREGVGQDLQRDLAVELGVGGLPDLAHAPLADQGGYVVVAEAGAGTQWHGWKRANDSRSSALGGLGFYW